MEEEEGGILLRRKSSFTLDQLRDVKWLQDTIIRCDHDLGTKDHIFCTIGHLGLPTVVSKTISIVIDDYKSIQSLVRFPDPLVSFPNPLAPGSGLANKTPLHSPI